MTLLRCPWILLCCAVALLVAGCGGGRPATAEDPAARLRALSPSVAEIDGEALPLALLEAHAARRGVALDAPEQRAALIDELATSVLLRQQARRGGLFDEPEALAQRELLELDLMSRLVVERFLREHPVSEAQIVESYQRQVLLDGGEEFHVRHMLFGDEAKALAMLDRVLAGEDFVALIEEVSAAGQAIQARDLGWVRAGQLPGEFAEALRAAPDGSVLPVPVRSEFGYHLIERVASRPFSPPPLDSVREGIRATLSERAARDYVEVLRSRARIDVRQ